MDDTDKKWFETWTEQNCAWCIPIILGPLLMKGNIDDAFWSKGAIDASLIVIDDPQRESSLWIAPNGNARQLMNP